jgi:hypothetical protein
MMNCQDCDERLGDYVDGALDATARAEVDAHLRACPACRAVVSDFEAIRSLSRELQPLRPGPQVWQRIAAATSRPSRRAWWASSPFGAWQPVLASAVAVLLAIGLSWTGQRLAEAPGTDGRGAIATTDGLDAEQQDVEAHYVTAIARLEQITSAERSALDPDTAEVLDAGLSVIDEAIVQSRAALGTQPESDLAQDSLYQALDRKVTVLQEMLALIDEMRRGGVVQVVSELNP